MLRESQNYLVIEGILSEIDLEDKSFVKDGTNKEAIGGSIKVKVNQDIEGVSRELEIPVHMFSTKITNKGTENPAYISIKKLMEDFKSIAGVGEKDADYVRITGAKAAMNEYFAPDGGRLISFPRVSASFINKIKREDCKMKATWEIEAYIGKMGYQVDKDGIETSTYEIKGITIGYGEKADIIPFVTNQASIAKALEATYKVGDTIPMSGRLNFSSRTETVLEAVEIGDPVEKTKTINISDLVITGVKNAKDEGAYTDEDIQAAIKARTARLEASKAKSQASKPGENKAPAAKGKGKVDLGF